MSSEPALLDQSLGCAAVRAQTSSVVFCADFDAVTDPGDGWTFVDRQDPGGTWSLDTTNNKTPPAAALLSAPSSGAGPTGGREPDLQLGYQDEVSRSRVTLAFDMRVDMPSFALPATFAVAELELGGVGVNLEFGQGKAVRLVGANDAVQVVLPQDIPDARTWFRVRIAIDGTSATLYFDGKQVASTTIPAAKGPLNAVIGAVYTYGPASTLQAQFDDVVITSP